jgi:TolA-binding protein
MYLRDKERERRQRLTALMSLMVLLFAFIAAVAGGYATGLKEIRPKQPATFSNKISALSKSLTDSAFVIDQIQDEIIRRQLLLEKLQKDADTAQQLAQINSSQANAIVQAIRLEVEREKNRDFWFGVVQNFVFAVLGVILAELWHFLRRRISTP